MLFEFITGTVSCGSEYVSDGRTKHEAETTYCFIPSTPASGLIGPICQSLGEHASSPLSKCIPFFKNGLWAHNIKLIRILGAPYTGIWGFIQKCLLQ